MSEREVTQQARELARTVIGIASERRGEHESIAPLIQDALDKVHAEAVRPVEKEARYWHDVAQASTSEAMRQDERAEKAWAEVERMRTTCRADHPTNTSAMPCCLPLQHEGDHESTTGCAGSVMRWPNAVSQIAAVEGILADEVLGTILASEATAVYDALRAALDNHQTQETS